MGITVVNEIDDGKKTKEVVFKLDLPEHSKHSNHLTKDNKDVFEWGLGGKCDDKNHKISCKVNLSGFDKHLEIEAKNGNTVVVYFSDGDYKLKKY